MSHPRNSHQYQITKTYIVCIINKGVKLSKMIWLSLLLRQGNKCLWTFVLPWVWLPHTSTTFHISSVSHLWYESSTTENRSQSYCYLHHLSKLTVFWKNGTMQELWYAGELKRESMVITISLQTKLYEQIVESSSHLVFSVKGCYFYLDHCYVKTFCF